MKTILILAALMMASTSFAKASKDDIKDRTKVAKRQFKQVVSNGATLGQLEEMYTVYGGQSNVPGVGIFSLRYVCTNGDSIQTTKPVNYCVQWAVNFKDKRDNEWTETYSSQHKANMAEDDKDAKGGAYCVAKSAPKIVTHPISFQVNGCVTWAVDFKDKRDNEWTKTYSDKFSANRAEDDRDARGSSYCVQKGMVNKMAPTSTTLKVYRKRALGENSLDKKDNKLFLGRWTYNVPPCGDLTPVPAN